VLSKRIVSTAIFVFCLFSALIIQFYRIQIVEGEKWKKEAQKQHRLLIPQPFKRGQFYSNTGVKKGHPEKPQSFVVDVPKFHLYVDPQSLKEECKHEVALQISKKLKLNADQAMKLRRQFDKRSRSRKIALWLSQETKESIDVWWRAYAKEKKMARNAIFYVQDYKRSYPFGKMLGPVLHTIREDKIPTGGLELIFDPVLKGTDGRIELLRSPRQPMDSGKTVIPPKNGTDIYLTINHCLQAICEEGIEKGVKAANGKSGWAIMMDPRTGEILALAQYPFFDLSNYQDYFNDPSKADATKVKAITDPYEPGSAMKPITALIALKANEELKRRGKAPLFSPEEKIATISGRFPGRSKPLKDIHTRKYVNMDIAIQKSSNIYVATLAYRIIDQLGAEWYRSVLHDTFGFGKKTGIELSSESNGQVPRPGKVYANGALEWSKATPASLSMGHNILTNSLQMLRVYAMIANGGFDVHPTLIKNDVVSTKRILEPEILKPILRSIRFCTKPGGGAKRADIPGYTTAGKTGTSEKIVNGTYSKKNHISTFIGFPCIDAPPFVLMIVVDEPEFKYIPGVGRNQLGGICCGPVFQDIGKKALEYLGIPPDDPDKKKWKEEVAQLKELMDKWNR
jgi:cell division protein FtsI (penicillin-binding protein 3)